LLEAEAEVPHPLGAYQVKEVTEKVGEPALAMALMVETTLAVAVAVAGVTELLVLQMARVEVVVVAL
jgi:hypothetical protein